MTPNGSRAICSSREGFFVESAKETLKVWDLTGARALFTLDDRVGVTAVALTPDGNRAISGSLVRRDAEVVGLERRTGTLEAAQSLLTRSGTWL